MSVTSMEANCGHVGIRSPHGWVRSTSFNRHRLSREPLDTTELLDDLLGDREIRHVRELHVLRDLPEALLAGDGPLDVRLRDALVLRPSFRFPESVERRLDHIPLLFGLLDAEVDDLRAVVC